MHDVLPVTESLAALKDALRTHNCVFLSAQTGSGKTTVVPTALLDAPWLGARKIVMLEPRRLAARLACEWMAVARGERVGEVVGYRTGQETRVSDKTRIEIMTEGVLTRRLQRDPELNDVGLIIFDEVHERHLATDLGLALVRDIQSSIRPDLRVLLMSATLERDAFIRHFGPVPWIEAQGRQHPIDIAYLPKPFSGYLDDAVRLGVSQVLARTSGDVLVFLPGMREILRSERTLTADARASGFKLVRLHGTMTPAEQDAALCPISSRRVILATAVAQSSVTIPTVDGVVDSGLMRVARFDKGSGFTRLITLAATHDISQQRAGRAGRMRAGYCLRLWTEADQRGRPRFASPEIENADLGQLALDLVAWGTADGKALSWITPPSPTVLTESQRHLVALQLSTPAHELTSGGRLAVKWGLPPRLAAVVIKAPVSRRPLACAVAALLAERDPLSMADDCSLEARLLWLRDHPRSLWGQGVHKIARRCDTVVWQGEYSSDSDVWAELLLFAYRDRIGVRTDSSDPTFKLASGQRVSVSARDPLSRATVLIALAVEDTPDAIHVRLAVPVSPALWAKVVADFATERLTVSWDERTHVLTARQERYLDQILLQSVPISAPPLAEVKEPLAVAVRRFGLTAVPWSEEARVLRLRLKGISEWQPERGWPQVDDEALIAGLDQWLTPALAALGSTALLSDLNVALGLRVGLLSPMQRAELDREAPLGLKLRTGRMRPLRYRETGPPVLAAPIQEFYGLREVPTIASGRLAPIVELLSPAGRPLQVTSDLAGFWRTIYPEIRRSLAARYPRHDWPLDPLVPPPLRKRS